MDSYEYEKRLGEFPVVIREISMRNPLIHRICQEYAMGSICFMNEALARMVVSLEADWGEKQRRDMEAFEVTRQWLESMRIGSGIQNSTQVCREMEERTL
jgi:hypothetical protein